MRPEDILTIYEREAAAWAGGRDTSLAVEGMALEAALADQRGARVLDLGCGAGEPIAAWFLAQGCEVTGVDGAAAMIARFHTALPDATAIHSDMRGLDLGRRFDVIVAWDSFFHLSAEDQRAMFPVFARHAAHGARLLLTTGDEESERLGRVGRSTVFHASLSPEDYRACLVEHGFEVVWFRPRDPALGGHSVWLARAQSV